MNDRSMFELSFRHTFFLDCLKRKALLTNISLIFIINIQNIVYFTCLNVKD